MRQSNAGVRFLLSVVPIAAFGLVASPLKAQSLHPMESRVRAEFPSVALGSPTTTFEAAEAMTDRGMVSGLRVRFADAATRKGLSPIEAANAQLAARDSAPSGLRVLYPRFFNDVIVAEADGQRVVLRAAGAHGVSAQPTNGKLIYEGTYDSVDTIEVPDANRSEELLLLRDDHAPLVYDYEIVEMTGVGGVVLHDGAIRFLRSAPSVSASQVASGKWEPSTPSIEIERPWVVDAMGRRLESAARWSLGEGPSSRTIRLTLAKGLAYPLLADPSFSTTGSLITARQYHTATLLQNGKVLIAGGQGNAGVLASAELFDPANGTFSTTGPLSAARSNHTATLLPNGKVLIAGGTDTGFSGLTSTELYDPASGTFSAAGPLITARRNHTATLLPNGKVLIAGGAGNSSALAAAELFDPASRAFSATGPLSTARFNHTATLLPNGKVLITGGTDSPLTVNPVSSAELYDTASGTFSATGPLGTARFYHTAALLPNGKVLIAGGTDSWSPLNPLGSAELYDPASGTFSVTGPLVVGRAELTATLLPNGNALIAGGVDTNGNQSTAAELFDPSSGTFSLTHLLITARYLHTATLLPSGKVLVAGGEGFAGIAASAELYDPAIGVFASTAGSLSTARSHHTATILPNGKVLIAGGNWSIGGYLASAELFDPLSGTFSATGPLLTGRTNHTATLLLNGKVLIAGGQGNAGNLASAELFDPQSGTFSATGPLGTGRTGHTATLLPNGKVLIAGGSGDSGFFASAELFDPASGTFSATWPMGTWRSQHTATLLPNARVLIAGGFGGTPGLGASYLASAELFDPASGTFSATGPLGTARTQQTATLLPNAKVLIAGGVNNVSGFLASAELFDPASGTFSVTASLVTPRGEHTATLLPNGTVLIGGGFNDSYSLTGELFDPSSATFSQTGAFSIGRSFHTATLLPNGKVLAAGGFNDPGYLASAKLFDGGDGYLDSRRPVISNAPVSITQPAPITFTGTGFLGDSEASGGATNNSSTNYPILQLIRLDNGQSQFVPSGTNWSAISFTSIPLAGLAAGYYRATIFSNAIPSLSTNVLILGTPGPTVANTNPSTCISPAGGDSITLTGTNLLNGTVTVNGNPATVINTTATTVVFTTPSGTAGSVASVVVTTTGGTAPTSYTYSTAPTPTITPGGPTTFTYPGSVTLNSSSATGYQWYLAGSPISVATNQAYVASDSGSYTVIVTDGNGCASAPSASANVVVNPSAPVVTAVGGTFVYNGTAQAGSGTATGGAGESLTVTLTYNGTGPTTYGPSATAPSLAGTYTVTAHTAGDANNNAGDSSATALTINKFNTLMAAHGGTVTYNGSPQAGTGQAIGGAGESLPITLSYLGISGTTYGPSATPPTNVGVYLVTAHTVGDANNNAEDSLPNALRINKASATIVVTAYCAHFDGSAHTATGTATGVLSEALTGLVLTSTTHTAAGTYLGDAWSFTNANYSDASGTVDDSIVDATITASSIATAGSAGNVASVVNAGAGAAYAWGITGGSITGGAGTNSITYTAGGAGTLTLNVTVTTSTTCSDVKSANEVILPLVTITSVSPANGTATGDTLVTINGSGFAAGATVTFGGTPATSVVVVSAIKITARTPAHANGSVNVTVTNTDTSTGTLPAGYLYQSQVFDPNNDNTITSADIFYLVNFLFLGGPPPNGPNGLLSGDANGDGKVDSADIFYIVNYLFLGGQKPNSPRSTPGVVRGSATAGQIGGSITLGTPVLRDGHTIVPVIMTTSGNSIVPQSMALRAHFDVEGAMGDVTVRRAGAASNAGVVFEINRLIGRDLSYLVSFDPRNGGLVLGSSHSAVVAEIEMASASGNVAISIDSTLTMLSDQSGTITATVGNGRLQVNGTTIGSGTSPRPRTQGNEVN